MHFKLERKSNSFYLRCHDGDKTSCHHDVDNIISNLIYKVRICLVGTECDSSDGDDTKQVKE